MKEVTFLKDIAECFEKLPGVGKKTAIRYAYYIMDKYPVSDVEMACNQLVNALKQIHKCPICGMYTTNDICEICNDETRDHQTILVVKDQKDLISIENTKQYTGIYHVLGGLIKVFEGITPEDLNIENLEKRVQSGDIKEVIIATSLTPAGDVTSMYIEKILADTNIKLSRIGYGLPAGSDLEYADELTIKRALDYRISKSK